MPGVAGVKIESLPKFAGDLMVRRRFVNKCNGNIYNSVVQGGGGPVTPVLNIPRFVKQIRLVHCSPVSTMGMSVVNLHLVTYLL